MKTDAQLQRDVIEELKWDPSVGRGEIGVAARDGVVTLSGQVDTYAQKYAAEAAAKRVGGVRAVAEDLLVQPPLTSTRTDTDIAHAALAAIRWDTEVPQDALTLRVENGWITLEGEVEWNYQKSAAERAVRYLTGVRGLTNLIVVRPDVSVSELRNKIEEALKRSAALDAKHIEVEAHEGSVVLSGKVRSWAERVDAERAAWSAPGVSNVEDRILIGA
ncbi:MAG TPA: BON domain-containing protein [Gemmatimonadaceae bacterium]|nr:BON domain-containing protein [Gemmatimonadaceae bacterium]